MRSIAQNRDNPFDGTGAVRSEIANQTATLSSQLDALNASVGGTNAALARIEETLAAGNWAGARVAFNNSF